MIVFINGPFGVGKSTTARKLATILPRAAHYNPEHIGAGLRLTMGPLYRAEDYQDLAAWRRLVPVGARLYRLRHETVVMPMTVWRKDYLEELLASLQHVEPEVRRFQLTAPREDLERRVLRRSDAHGGHEWWWAHLESGLAMAADPDFGEAVDTGGRAPLQVASEIAARIRQGR